MDDTEVNEDSRVCLAVDMNGGFSYLRNTHVGQLFIHETLSCLHQDPRAEWHKSGTKEIQITLWY
jgi:hypothetical protein